MYSYEDLDVGQQQELNKTLSEADIDAFAHASGDRNPIHLDREYAQAQGFKDRIAHGMLLASWISAMLAERLPGPGTVYLRQGLEFRRPALPGDSLKISLTIAEKRRRGRVLIDCLISNQDGEEIVRGEAEVIAPAG
ncbi:MAG: MaoC family dehydratase [Pseudomonadota bacterium]